ncbi:MAG: DUF3772 domain-containing protein, partial [Pseudomonadota bacterium]
MGAHRYALLAVQAVLFACMIGVGGGFAQSSANEAPDYSNWEQVATEAEEAIAEEATPTARLTELREVLSGWRANFLDAESINRDRVATLRAQVAALGTAPDTDAGETEPPDIAARRSELTSRLADAEAPQLRALEAYNRANGMISEIDDVVRTRQTEALLEAVPTPANPANWPPAFEALYDVARDLASEAVDTFGSEIKRRQILRRLPVTLAFFAASILMLMRGRSWMTYLTDFVQGGGRWQGRLVIGFVISITQVLVPLAGFLLFIAAVASLNPSGSTGLSLLEGLVWVVVIVYGALWLVNRVFPLEPGLPTLFDLEMAPRRRLRRSGILIGSFMGAWAAVQGVTGLESVAPSAAAVLNLPIFLVLGYGYWRLSRQLVRALKAASSDEAQGFGMWALLVMGRLLGVVALIGPISALAGYNALATAVTIPTGYTLGLVGLFIALQWPIRDLYSAVTRTNLETAGDALVPVLINGVLLIAALPLLALTWGMRPERLGEIYARVMEGIPLGDTRLTPGVVLTVALVFAGGYMA